MNRKEYFQSIENKQILIWNFWGLFITTRYAKINISALAAYAVQKDQVNIDSKMSSAKESSTQIQKEMHLV